MPLMPTSAAKVSDAVATVPPRMMVSNPAITNPFIPLESARASATYERKV